MNNKSINQPILSVAIITYNQEKFISQTLDSILNQEHNYPYEIVIGEDCSTDGTKKIIEEYAQKYPEIIKPLYNNPNKGLIQNYFNVIAHCSGKYIMECAGDDYWLPGKVQKQIDFMEKHEDCGLCYGKALLYNEINKTLSKQSVGKKSITFTNLLFSNNIPAVTICIRNEILNKYINDVNPIEKPWLMEDYPIWCWVSKNSKIYFIPKKICVYRIIENSISHSRNEEKNKSFNKSCLEIKEFFCKTEEEQKLLSIIKNIDLFNSLWANKKWVELVSISQHIPYKYLNRKEKIKKLIINNKFLFRILLK